MHKLFNGRDVHVDFCKETSKKTTEVSNTVIMLVCPLRFPKKRVKNKKKEPFRFYQLRFFLPRVLSPARPAPPAMAAGPQDAVFLVFSEFSSYFQSFSGS